MHEKGDKVWSAGFDNYTDRPRVESATVVTAGQRLVRVDKWLPCYGRLGIMRSAEPGYFHTTKRDALAALLTNARSDVANAESNLRAAERRLANTKAALEAANHKEK